MLSVVLTGLIALGLVAIVSCAKMQRFPSRAEDPSYYLKLTGHLKTKDDVVKRIKQLIRLSEAENDFMDYIRFYVTPEIITGVFRDAGKEYTKTTSWCKIKDIQRDHKPEKRKISMADC